VRCTVGARVNLLVKEVITNPSAFEKSTAHDSAVDLTRLDACTSGHGSRDTHESARRLVIQPRHRDAASPHCCPICPANLCKVFLRLYFWLYGAWGKGGGGCLSLLTGRRIPPLLSHPPYQPVQGAPVILCSSQRFPVFLVSCV